MSHSRLQISSGESAIAGGGECSASRHRCAVAGKAELLQPSGKEFAPGLNSVAARLWRGKDGEVQVAFADPQRAVAPGQAAVYYHGDRCLGAGWIDSALDHADLNAGLQKPFTDADKQRASDDSSYA